MVDSERRLKEDAMRNSGKHIWDADSKGQPLDELFAYFSTSSPLHIFNVILVSSWSPTINGPFGLTSISF